MDDPVWKIHTDGGARGNPGPAAFAFVIERPGAEDVEENGCLGETTNNIAEYTALVRALERARQLGGKKLIIHSDSELMVQQMNGAYKVKNPGILELYKQAKDLARHFDAVTIRHVRREHNRRADELANEAMDRKLRTPRPAPARPKPTAKDTAEEALRRWVLDRLKAAAAQWARGDASDPDPAGVADEIVTVCRTQEDC